MLDPKPIAKAKHIPTGTTPPISVTKLYLLSKKVGRISGNINAEVEISNLTNHKSKDVTIMNIRAVLERYDLLYLDYLLKEL